MTELQERQKESLEQAKVWYNEGLEDGRKEKTELIEKIKNLICNDCGYTHNENGFCEFSNCRTKVILERDILDTFKQAEKIEENTIIIGDYEYETKTHDFNKCLKDIKIPKGWELWTVSDFEKFNLKEWDKLGLKDSWFFIKYPFAFNLNNCVAGFIAYSGRADWYCNRNSSYSNDGLGVRFRRKVKAVEE